MDKPPPRFVDGSVWLLLALQARFDYLDAHVRYLLDDPDQAQARRWVRYLEQLAQDIREERIGGPHDDNPARVRRFRLWRSGR